MSKRDLIVDLSSIDLTRVLADLETIRRFNQQRYEMEQLTAVIYEDLEQKSCVGYKDVTDHEFWVRGHMPSMPLMPGVVMLEAAAQLSSYFVHRHHLLGEGITVVGFGGLEEVKFRDPVYPGSRLYLLCKMERVRVGRLIVCRFQGVVGGELVVEGILKGAPILPPANPPATPAGQV